MIKILAVLFIGSILFMPALAPVFAWLYPEVEPPVYARLSFVALTLSHIGYVVISSLVAALLGTGCAIMVTRDKGQAFRPAAQMLASIGQSFPPAAVLALAVPLIGFGATPTLLALALYGLLPILENAIAGLDGVPKPVREAARAMGLSPLQMLWQIELPLAAPMILTGIRLSTIINIGTTTIGGTVGAVTLGTPILNGLIAGKPGYVIQGAILVGLLAILTDQGFERLTRYVATRA